MHVDVGRHKPTQAPASTHPKGRAVAVLRSDLNLLNCEGLGRRIFAGCAAAREALSRPSYFGGPTQ